MDGYLVVGSSPNAFGPHEQPHGFPAAQNAFSGQTPGRSRKLYGGTYPSRPTCERKINRDTVATRAR